jgi:serine/threonine protein kinase
MISRSHLTASSTTSKSVQRELAVLQLLHHPHLIDLKQVLQDTQYVYFVMEYLEGGELFHVLAERGRLPESEARHLFIQLITALTWCHAHHIRYILCSSIVIYSLHLLIFNKIVIVILNLKISCWTRKRKTLKLLILVWQLCNHSTHYFEQVVGNVINPIHNILYIY